MNDLNREVVDEKTGQLRPIRIGVYDIESSGLNADFGFVFCISLLDARTKKVYTVRIDDPRNPDKKSDKWVIKEGVKLLDSYDMLVDWYGTRFDIPFIDSRAAKHRLPFHIRNYHRDLWFTSRSRFKLRSNRLAVVGEYLFGKTLKDAITPEVWNSAIRGEKKALNYIVNHCEKDLFETYRVYMRMMPLFPLRLRKQ